MCVYIYFSVIYFICRHEPFNILMTCMHVPCRCSGCELVIETVGNDNMHRRNSLVFVHWIDENWPTCFIAQNALENTLIEVSNS